MRKPRLRLSYANVMASIAVFGVLAGGGAYAASTIGSNQIKKNAVKTKHIANGAVKPAKLSAKAQTLWAVVDDDGTLVRGRGAVDADDDVNSGRYSVTFNRNVRGCAYVVSAGTTAPGTGISPPLTGTVFTSLNQPRVVGVQLNHVSGSGTNNPFHVQVTC